MRVVPHSLQPRTACLRVEFYGCHYKGRVYERSSTYRAYLVGGLVSYATEPPSHVDFPDLEGSADDANSSKRLGLLADDFIAQSLPTLALGAASANHTWLAWRLNDTGGRLEVRFDFDKLYHFTHVDLFGYGAPFPLVALWLSTDAETFGDAVQTRYRDTLGATGKDVDFYKVRVPIEASARVVKLLLTFETEWLYLSEVQFGMSKRVVALSPHK